ncbi:uncharacterized protein LOC117785234 [Drosophila innubila]|uniref:uncharacterized protein LOC117785234 n=1 Tax=Drosophila innubila TaxID=198719 RepID=UPI00148B62E6|nr:uncharacterized protein LOC117785234 [Drosophila innubila]
MAVPQPTADRCHDKKYKLFKMLGEYLDLCIRISVVVFCANFIERLCSVSIEYIFYKKYYLPEDRLSTIIRRACTYNVNTIWLAIMLLLLGFARFGSTGNLKNLLPNHVYLACMPLYWVFSFAQLSYRPLGYAHWIRGTHGLDYAAGMASNYFHGYLKLALPERNDDGLKKRMQVYEDTHSINFATDRLIILIPDDMFVKGIIVSDLLEKAEPLETTFINRAGVNRPFKHAVYRLKRQINGTTYYFAMEGATPMLSFFEAMNSQSSTSWQMREMKREIWLKFAKHLKELTSSWPETEHEVELFIYNSRNLNGESADVGELLFAHFEARLGNKKQLN